MNRVMMMCESSHLYEGRLCPYDGSQSPHAEELAQAIERLRNEGILVSVDALRACGVSDEALRWVVVVEFGSGDVAFEAIEVASVVVDGKRRDQLGLTEE
jgi:hypothetical protein